MGRTRLPEHVRRLIPHAAKRQPAQNRKQERPAHWPPGVESELELKLLTRIERAGLPSGHGQARIIPGRGFVFDRVWPAQRVAVEVQGGLYINGAHSRGSGVERDCLKASMAAALGWRVLPVSKAMIESGQAVELIAQALGLAVRDGR